MTSARNCAGSISPGPNCNISRHRAANPLDKRHGDRLLHREQGPGFGGIHRTRSDGRSRHVIRASNLTVGMYSSPYFHYVLTLAPCALAPRTARPGEEQRGDREDAPHRLIV